MIVVGGGPAGIMAAIAAAEAGASVTLWERNRQLGKKLAITGKGRCNITNNAPSVQELVRHIPGNGPFLYGAFSRFSVQDTLDFFTAAGLPLRTERGRRVFPLSDNAQDVVAALEKRLEQAGVCVRYGMRAKKLALSNGAVAGVYDFSGALHPAGAVIVATGGVSYPLTGSTGDGYSLAEQASHSIVPPRPSLAPLETVETWPAELAGLALKNVDVSLYQGDKLLEKGFGEMLFTHFGVSGPLILTLSRAVCFGREQGGEMRAVIDLKPALDAEQLDQRVQRNFLRFSRKYYQNSLGDLLPASLIPVFVGLSGIPGDKPVNQISREERRRLVTLLKGLALTVKGPRPIDEAIVTAGGVNVREVDPKTMASRLVRGLYFAGEVLDIDGYTGGYNLQAAWSSGYVAGCAAAALLSDKGAPE